MNASLASSFDEPLQLKEDLDVDPLKDLLQRSDITEVIINGHQNICFESQGKLHPHAYGFPSPRSFDRFLQKIFEEAQIKVDLEHPFVSFTWKEFRGHVALSPLSPSGTLLTFRRLKSESPFTLEQMLQMNSLTTDQLRILKEGIQSKKNILVVGGTGSGKTTLLSGCLREASSTDRFVILEDTSEIQIPNSMSAKLLTREASPSLPKFDLGDLLRQSLRMRPDRLVVGEVRGGEAKDLLMALSTGHQGSFATLHASSPQEALLRLEMLIQMGAPHWSLESIKKLISLTMDWIVVLKKEKGQRKLDGIHHITSLESVGFLLQKLC